MSTPYGGRSSHLERKTVEKTVRELEVLMKFRGVPQLHRSHPYLPDIAQETRDLLRLILKQNPWSELGHNLYLQVTVQSLLYKTAQCTGILRGASGVYHVNGSSLRRNLTKMSLIFSHILSELKAIFPGGNYQGNSYRVTKHEAAKFWSHKFGPRCLVQWAEFRAGLNSVHVVGDGPLESALRSTIDLTCNDHVSVYEFDIFTRLFQPWDTLLQNWMLLAVTHPGYMAFQTYDEVRDHLQGNIHRPGSYIFRLSCTHLGQWAIGYVTSEGTILQTIPHNKSLFQALQEGEKEGLYLYPNGLSGNPDLSLLASLASASSSTEIQVTQEQWELYSDMDSSFELCKICADNKKNVRIQPCGHLLCDQCLSAWQKSDGLTCPFCRAEIRGKEEITISDKIEPEEQSTAATGACPQQSPYPVDPEEEDWIRKRPLPATPGSPHMAQVPHPSAPPVPSARSTSKTAPPRPPVPPRRMKLQAFDIIGGHQEASRLPRGAQGTNNTRCGRRNIQANHLGSNTNGGNTHQ
ncbi:E3 ubiquitin-protein ligase CBL-C [Pelodytes ibericus]